MQQLFHKLPPLDQVPADKFQDVYDRLREVFASNGYDLDLSPTSVLGNLVLSPFARVIAAYEVAAECVTTDLDLAKVAGGNICDCDFVKSYMGNFGVDLVIQTPVITTLRLSYNVSKEYKVPLNTQFVFDDFHFFPLSAEHQALTIKPRGATNVGINDYALSQLDTGVYVVEIPAFGPPQSEVDASAGAETNLPDTELISVETITDVLPNTPPTEIKDLLKFAREVYPSASLSTRASAVSFIRNRFPRATGISPVMPGDIEMTRASSNVLGIHEPAMDLYIKGDSASRRWRSQLVDLTYDGSSQEWRGAVNTPDNPVWFEGIFAGATRNSLQSQQSFTVVSKGAGDGEDLTDAYSGKESYGIRIPDSTFMQESKLDVIATDVWEDGDTGMKLADGDATLSVSGQFIGNAFTEGLVQDIQLTFQSAGTAVVRDLRSNDVVGDATFVGGSLDLAQSDPELYAYLNGLGLDVADGGGSLAGKSFTLRFRGETARARVGYVTDPVVRQVESVVSSPDVSPPIPVNVMGFRTAVVDSLEIFYRKAPGKFTDTGKAQNEVFDYVNDASYPSLLEESSLHDIMLWAGARGVKEVELVADLHFTPADFISPDGSDGYADANVEVPAPELDDWKVDESEGGHNTRVGSRNVAFFIPTRGRVILTEVGP